MTEKMTPHAWLRKKHRFLFWPMVILVAMSAVLSGAAVLFAFVSKVTIDAAQFRNTEVFVYGAVAIVSVLGVQIIIRALFNYLTVYWQSQTDKHLKNVVFGDILKKKQQAIEKRHTGELMNYLHSDVERISHGVLEILPRFVFLVLRFLFAFVLLFMLEVTFALILLVFGAMLFVVSVFVRNALKRRHNAMQDAEAKVRAFIAESFEHLALIKAFEAESYTKYNMSNRQSGFVKAKLAKHRLSVLAGTALQGFFAAGYAFAIIFGAYKIGMNALTFGSLIAILQLVEFMQAPFAGMSTLFPKYYGMLASTERIIALDTIPKEEKTLFDKLPELSSIRFENVDFTYNEMPVLTNFTLTIPSGAFVHIKGDSGIGKTTVFKLLLGLIEPSEGHVFIETVANAYPCSIDTRALFAYVPQGLMMASGTIAENLAFNQKNVTLEKMQEACKIAGILEAIEALPEGFQTVLGQRGIGLSEGEIQRLAIARALLKDAPILLLDEITSALDQATEVAVLENIKALTDKTCLIISHRPLAETLIDQTIAL